MKYLLLFLYLTLLLDVTGARPTAGQGSTTVACTDCDRRKIVPWPTAMQARDISRRKVTPVQTSFM